MMLVTRLRQRILVAPVIFRAAALPVPKEDDVDDDSLLRWRQPWPRLYTLVAGKRELSYKNFVACAGVVIQASRQQPSSGGLNMADRARSRVSYWRDAAVRSAPKADVRDSPTVRGREASSPKARSSPPR